MYIHVCTGKHVLKRTNYGTLLSHSAIDTIAQHQHASGHDYERYLNLDGKKQEKIISERRLLMTYKKSEMNATLTITKWDLRVILQRSQWLDNQFGSNLWVIVITPPFKGLF